jgi:hypothetical protein
MLGWRLSKITACKRKYILPWVNTNTNNISIGERTCPDLSTSFVTSPPLIQFFGVVDTAKFVLADCPGIGLDYITRNSSAIFLTWSKFPDLENGVKPESGWYPNYVYAMLPKTKPHLTKKCQGYKADSTPFRSHGKKAYVRGYMHGFCNKINMFAEGGRPNNLEYIPFIEIMEVDWAPNSNDAKSIPADLPATPSRRDVKPDVASSRTGKRKIAFDPFADLNTGSSLTFGEKLARSEQKPARE